MSSTFCYTEKKDYSLCVNELRLHKDDFSLIIFSHNNIILSLNVSLPYSCDKQPTGTCLRPEMLTCNS